MVHLCILVGIELDSRSIFAISRCEKVRDVVQQVQGMEEDVYSDGHNCCDVSE